MANIGICSVYIWIVFCIVFEDQGPGASHYTSEKNENSVCLFWQHKHETICGHEVRTPRSLGLSSSGWGYEVP